MILNNLFNLLSSPNKTNSQTSCQHSKNKNKHRINPDKLLLQFLILLILNIFNL